MTDLFSVRDKVVLVTGGTRGLGKMIARGFVEHGARVYVTSRKTADCAATESELGALGDCRALPSDLARPEEIARLVDELTRREPELDVLVNNAGTTWGAPLATYPLDAWDRVFAVNVRAVFQLTRDLLPQLQARATALEPSRVINVGSIAGERVTRATHSYAYGASKAAVHHLTRILSMDLAACHITVNSIAPGVFASRMTGHRVGKETMLEVAARGTPQGRAGAREDIVGTCLWLSARAGAHVTGAVIPLDGGLHTKPTEWRGDAPEMDLERS